MIYTLIIASLEHPRNAHKPATFCFGEFDEPQREYVATRERIRRVMGLLGEGELFVTHWSPEYYNGVSMGTGYAWHFERERKARR